MQAPLKAAEVNNGLYILFQKVVIFTLTGRESVVGDRYNWTMEELLEVLEGMPEGSTILRYNMTRREAFFNFLRFSLDRFVDQEAGTCDFDSQGFRDLLRFLESLPDEVESEDPADAEEEVKRRIRNGQQMLEGRMIDWQIDIGISDAIWQERAAFPGYPTADGSSGSFFIRWEQSLPCPPPARTRRPRGSISANSSGRAATKRTRLIHGWIYRSTRTTMSCCSGGSWCSCESL